MSGEQIQDKNIEDNPWVDFSMRELPTTSVNGDCEFYLKEIERCGRMEKVAHFIDEKLAVQPKLYHSTEGFYADNPDYIDDLMANLDANEVNSLKKYTGTGVTGFVGINTVARGFWDYEKMGRSDAETKAEINDTITFIDEAISKSPSPSEDFLTFRGTNLDAFRKYNINNIADLQSLKGEFYLERGFVSTALNRENSFADREDTGLWFGGSNIEVRYHIPAGSHDFVALFTDELSYSPQQTEVLINRWSLFYVSDVRVDENKHAIVDMLLLPKDLYDY